MLKKTYALCAVYLLVNNATQASTFETDPNMPASSAATTVVLPAQNLEYLTTKIERLESRVKNILCLAKNNELDRYKQRHIGKAAEIVEDNHLSNTKDIYTPKSIAGFMDSNLSIYIHDKFYGYGNSSHQARKDPISRIGTLNSDWDITTESLDASYKVNQGNIYKKRVFRNSNSEGNWELLGCLLTRD